MRFFYGSDCEHEVESILPAIYAERSNGIFDMPLSRYGHTVMEMTFDSDPPPWNHFKEIVFETIRIQEYPRLPSRLSCTLAARSIKDVPAQARFIGVRWEHVYEIEADAFSLFDAKWLDFPKNNFVSWATAAREYWSSCNNPGHLTEEALVFGSAIIIRECTREAYCRS